MKHFPKKENHLTILGICYTWRDCSYLQVLPVGTYEPNTVLVSCPSLDSGQPYYSEKNPTSTQIF